MNEPLLELLRASAPEWVSGEVLRRSDAVSRVMISKRIRRLVEEGYVIESSPRKGYRLVFEPDIPTAARMLPLLQGTRFAVGEWQWTERSSSTNDDVRRMALAGAPEGSVAVADVQEAGRGRRGRAWFGAPGASLAFSLLLRPPIEPRRSTLLPLLAAVGVHSALQKLGLRDIGIKWPNDILAGDRKLCGILCEMSLDMDRIESAAMGIGLNVNTLPGDFPTDIRGIACSLAMVSGRRWNRCEVLAVILRELDVLLEEAWNKGFEEMLQRWRAGSVTLGRRIEVVRGDGSLLEGVTEDIGPEGALLLRDDAGLRHTLHSGEVSLGKRLRGSPTP